MLIIKIFGILTQKNVLSSFFGPAWRTETRAAGERQNKKASCLCRAKVGSAGRFPEGYCCFPDGVEHGINQANSLLPAAI